MTASLSPPSVELRNDLDDFVVKLHQSRNERLDWPPTKIGERYLRDQITLALELVCDFGQRKFGMCALVSFDNGTDGMRKISPAAWKEQDKLAVFVEDVHVVNDEQQTVNRVGGVVRLKAFNEAKNFGICDSLYFSLVEGTTVFIDRFLFKDGKFDASRTTPSVFFARELPSEMVKARTQVVDDFTRDDAVADWDGAIPMVVNSLKEKLVVILGQDGVFAFLKEPCDFGLQITDTLVGPF
jgi:hypothetical protein